MHERRGTRTEWVACVSILAVVACPLHAHAQANCDGTTAFDAAGAPLVPVDALAGPYVDRAGHSFEPGLYGGGRNERPAEHAEAGRRFAEQASVPRHPSGEACPGDPSAPDNADCRAVVLAISMSNGTQEWSGAGPDRIDPALGFVAKASASPARAPWVVAVDGARGGTQAQCMSGRGSTQCREVDGVDLFSFYWNEYVPRQLSAAGVTAEQVVVAWVKVANHEESDPDHAAKLESDVVAVVQILRDRFPNLAMAYLNSRSYGGYIPPGGGNEEPIAYEHGLVMAKVIARQIAGDPDLCFDAQGGCDTPRAPWLDWGVYLWANGTTPNGQGVRWLCSDFRQDDGQHPSADGVSKVSDLLLDYFTNDPIARIWFSGVAPGPDDPPTTDPDAGPAGEPDAGPGSTLPPTGDAGDDPLPVQPGASEGGCSCRVAASGRSSEGSVAILSMIGLLSRRSRAGGRRPRARRS